MRIHFRSRHVRDDIWIEEEGQLPRCTSCGIFMKDANSAKHQGWVGCWRFTIVREKGVRAEIQVMALEVKFTIGGVEINCVKQFRYLGQVLDENDDDKHAAGRQLTRARDKWTCIEERGGQPQSDGIFLQSGCSGYTSVRL